MFIGTTISVVDSALRRKPMKHTRIIFMILLVAGLASTRAEPQEIAKPAYDIKNFLRLNEHICTGGQPSLDDLTRMKAEGIKAIINLRRPGESNFNAEEEAARANELGLRYFHIPVNSNAPKDEQVEEFLKLMRDPANRPVFIHCMSANRVGAFWMIRRVLVDNWKLDDAVKEAEKIGLTNPKTREFALDYITRHKK
jgi:uncharacterized protein (TIGR01244 family)